MDPDSSTGDSKKKILVIQTALIGDVILVIPLINSLKTIYPDSAIDVVVVPKCAELLENNPNIRHVLRLDKSHKKIINFLSFIMKLRKEKYDISVSPHSSPRSGIMAYHANIPIRAGFKRNLQSYLLTHSIPYPQKIHKILKNLSLITILPDIKPSDDMVKLPPGSYIIPSSSDEKKATKLIESLFYDRENDCTTYAQNFAPKRHLVIISPGSLSFTKRWPLRNYLLLTEMLLQKDFFIILTGSHDERGNCEYIFNVLSEKMPGKADNIKVIAGEYSLLEYAAIIKQADLMICNDSGSLHMANAVDTPVFAFFGSTTQSVGYFPYRERDFVFEVELPCRPCGSQDKKKCPKKHFDCMKSITVDAVYKKIEDFFHTDAPA
jgi:heptosyltransferase-2